MKSPRMVGNEENLFRRFRLSWVPTWVPDWLESSLHSVITWQVLAIVLTTTVLSYFAIGYFQQQTGQDYADISAWKQRLTDAPASEFPVLLDTLFQVKNEQTLALGIDYLRSPDSARRQAAGWVLRDAAEKWNDWPIEQADPQWERAVRILAQIADQLHAPEQALAVKLGQLALQRPLAFDATIRASLLSNSRMIFSRAHPAHTAGIEQGALASDSSFVDSRSRWDEPALLGSPSPLMGPDGTRQQGPERGNLVASGRERFSGSDSVRFTPAGFARQSAGDSRANEPQSQRDRFDRATSNSLLPQTSQVPLFDESGRLIETQSIDPADLSVPGGLIPVGVSSPFRNARLTATQRNVSSDATTHSAVPKRSSPDSQRIDSQRTGSSRVSMPDMVSHESTVTRDHVGDDDASRRRELDAAYEIRSRSISASGPASRSDGIRQTEPSAGSSSRSAIISGPETEIVTSRPADSSASPLRDTGATPATPTPPNSYRPNSNGPNSNRSSPPPATSGTSEEDSASGLNSMLAQGQPTPRRIPENIYRSSSYSLNGSRQSQPDSDSAGVGGAVDPLEADKDAVRKLEVYFRQLTHIEVMQQLRNPDLVEARQAVQELTRRGFNADYIAAARRLTSSDARERYQLVLDLVASTRIEPAPFLRWLANDPDPQVRGLAIEALELLNSSRNSRAIDATSRFGQTR